MISVGPGLVDRMIGEFRACGRGLRECVVYCLAAQADPERVIDIEHPEHAASASGYTVNDRWLTDFFFRLADDRRMAVAQIHTHPGDWVDHSPTDDEFVLVPSPGFVSVVVPDFGEQFERSRCAIHVLERSGSWRLDAGGLAW